MVQNRRLFVSIALSCLALAAVAAENKTGYIMRLNLHKGQVIKYKLLVERDNPKISGVFSSSYTITDVHLGVISMECRATGLTVDGKDRTKDLNAVWGGQVAKLPWTTLSHRTGAATGYETNGAKDDILPFLSEAGIYLAYFKQNPVEPGDSWDGATTATGGCTNGTFTLTDVKKVHGQQLAYFDVTKIMFVSPTIDQVGPMHMIVNLSTGLPTVVDYKVKSRKSGRTSHFRQTLVS
jgi:hypothetical protein